MIICLEPDTDTMIQQIIPMIILREPLKISSQHLILRFNSEKMKSERRIAFLPRISLIIGVEAPKLRAFPAKGYSYPSLFCLYYITFCYLLQ